MIQPAVALASAGDCGVDAGQEVLRDVRQQAHGDELGRADAEAAEGEGQQRETNTGRRQRRRPVGDEGHPSILARIESIRQSAARRCVRGWSAPGVTRSLERRLESLDLAVDLARVAGPDVGLQHQRDPRAVLGDGLGGAAHDVEDLVPLPLDLVNIESVWFGRPDSRTIRTAAATASCTDPSLRPVPLGATENATNMIPPRWFRRPVRGRYDAGCLQPATPRGPPTRAARRAVPTLRGEQQHERRMRREQPAVEVRDRDVGAERDRRGEHGRQPRTGAAAGRRARG